MSNSLLRSERRREQNRRAQANLRRKRQERIEDLQQQIRSLEAQAVHTEQSQSRNSHDENNREIAGLSNGYNSFQASTRGLPSYPIEENLLLNNSSMSTFDPFLSWFQPLPTQPYPMSSMVKLPATPELFQQAEKTHLQNLMPAFYQYHCAFDALAKNASLLGISPETFLSTSSISIFYSPLKSLTSIRASVRHLPPEFHPTMAQLSYPHQPWIDCIPLPDLRSRIIFAVSHRPPFLDSLDVWHDVLSDGLSCTADPTDAHLWTMSNDFVQRWQMLLRIDLTTLETMCLASNPPVRKMNLHRP